MSEESILLFESARSAIAATLFACGIGEGDEVIVSSFTCDAVTYAVLETGARVVYVDINSDLTMSEACVFEATTDRTKAIILQNTFGRAGLRTGAVDKFKARGILIIEDNCLSYGSRVGSTALGKCGDVAISSLEVSKTVTIGWGGVLRVNNNRYSDLITNYYKALPRVTLVQDIRRLFQLWFSVFMIRLSPPGGFIMWHFVYGVRLFRKSSTSEIKISKVMAKMGHLSATLYNFVQPRLNVWIDQTHRNLMEIENYAESFGLDRPIKYREGEYAVSPRFSVIATNIDEMDKLGKRHGVEVGRWFSDCPPKYRLDECRIHSCVMASDMASRIVNIPCHWTLTGKEKVLIKELLVSMSRSSRNSIKATC